jgi:hypothetical protein
MEIKLKGKDMILISRLIKKLKLRIYLRELKKEFKDQDIKDFNQSIDSAFIMGDLILYVCEQIDEAIDEIDEILQSTLDIDITILSYEEKARLTVDIIKNAIPKSIMDSLEALNPNMNIKKNSNQEKN